MSDPIQMQPPQPPMPSMAAVPNGANPILDSISSLPPEAHQALMQAHQQVVDHHVNQARMAPPAPAMPSMGNPDPNGSLRPGGTTDAMPAMPPEQAQHVMGPPQKGTTAGDQGELSRLNSTGSGLDQIHSPWIRDPLKILTGIVGATPIGHAIETAIPGTDQHHQMLVNQQQGIVNNDLKGDLTGAQISGDQAKTKLENVQAEELPRTNDNREALADEKERHNQEVESEAQRRQGLGPDGKPIPYEQLTPHEQGIQDVQKAHQEELEATAQLRQYQSNPNSPQARAALARVQNARTNQQLGWAKLGLARDNFNFKTQDLLPGGQIAPGAPTTEDGTPIAGAFAKYSEPTTEQRNTAGRADEGEKIRQRILTQLKDPNIRSQLGPILGRAKNAQEAIGNLPPELAKFGQDLKSYAAFQLALHPVKGIGGLQYFDKVMGGLGQDPGQLEGKLASSGEIAHDVQAKGTPHTYKSGGWSAPSDAPTAPKEDNKVLKADGKVIAKSKGGQWVQP